MRHQKRSVVGISLPEKEKQAVRIEAAKAGVSMSAWLTSLIRKEIGSPEKVLEPSNG